MLAIQSALRLVPVEQATRWRTFFVQARETFLLVFDRLILLVRRKYYLILLLGFESMLWITLISHAALLLLGFDGYTTLDAGVVRFSICRVLLDEIDPTRLKVLLGCLFAPFDWSLGFDNYTWCQGSWAVTVPWVCDPLQNTNLIKFVNWLLWQVQNQMPRKELMQRAIAKGFFRIVFLYLTRTFCFGIAKPLETLAAENRRHAEPVKVASLKMKIAAFAWLKVPIEITKIFLHHLAAKDCKRNNDIFKFGCPIQTIFLDGK